ncbi:MAG: hypothetical protein OHK0021_11720 [Bryobacter sp.]
MPPINGEFLGTAILFLMTIGLMFFRYNAANTESNWPLVYYALAVIHYQMFEGGLDQRVLFSAIFAAGLLRFEFLAGWPLKLVQVVEAVLLALIAYRLFDLIFL